MSTMFDYSSFKKCKGRPEWFCQSGDGKELLVSGDDLAPNAMKLESAKQVVASLPDVERKAIQFLCEFMKDSGTWSLDEINFGEDAVKNECDFLLGFGFEQTGKRHEYQYCYFSVCFALREGNPPPHNTPHPHKLIMEIR